MKNLKELLDEKREKVKNLRTLVLELKLHEKDLKILERAYELMGGETKTETEPSFPLLSTSRTYYDTEISNSDAVETLLELHKKPLHLDQLYKEIESRYKKDTTKQSVVAAIIRYGKKGKRFIRTAPNTFGLLKWENEYDNTFKIKGRE